MPESTTEVPRCSRAHRGHGTCWETKQRFPCEGCLTSALAKARAEKDRVDEENLYLGHLLADCFYTAYCLEHDHEGEDPMEYLRTRVEAARERLGPDRFREILAEHWIWEDAATTERTKDDE